MNRRMPKFRRYRTPVAVVLLVLLAAPARALCCAWTMPMPCCSDSRDARLVPTCCVDGATQAPDRPMPSPAAKSLRSDLGTAAVAAADAAAILTLSSPAPSLDRFAGPPGSDRLYLRLSVIRR